MKHFLLMSLMLFVLTACKVEEQLIDSVVNYAEPPTERYSSPSDPARVLPANPAGCPAWEKNTTVQITDSVRLPAGCKYDRVSIHIINQENLVFDCNGAELNGLDKAFRQKTGTTYLNGQEPISIGIKVQSSENFQSRNITIRNCHLKNYVRGIRVNFPLNRASNNDLKNNVNVVALENYLRSISPKNIRVENSTINFSHKDGVFIGRFITDFVLDNSTIDSTGAVGLYIDSGAANNTIRNSSFINNGYSDYDSRKHEIKRKLKDYSREAIAIDSSMNNKIDKNQFNNNSRGSVFLYKNCNEHHTNATQIPRYQSADGNTISNNTFGSDESIGVWIASRQSADLKALECGSPLVATDTVHYGPVKDTTYYYEDFAKNNLVVNNTFNGVRTGVIVEDDDNIVRGNTFSGSSKYDVVIGTKYRTEKLSHPVTNIEVKSNTFGTSATEHVRLRYDSVDVLIKENSPNSVNN